ncbi:retained isoform X2 [Brevipalpus obovatus]|uniref:retained isoform X2 n=1 Tax=Brevipalpus obovatus TaxID=246614 RepID=UPI003D9F772E
MDGNESDIEESVSNPEEEDMQESDFDDEEANQREAGQREALAAVAASIGMGLWTPGPLPLNIPNNGVSSSIVPANASPVITSSSPEAHSASSGPSSSGGGSGTVIGNSGAGQQHLEACKGYTFEEQFKQLYELSDDPKRKEFLDDLFTYMQKRGTPVNRIPIMAKQVLDLFELYRLVVARGGLVEVINKKIWREITKGLNLPSSITSAAFTLRTQYMKYLYPYECEKEQLSSPDELQQAIDGNRREGRRSSYGHYADMVNPSPSSASGVVSRNHTPSHHTSPLSLVSRHLNGHGSQGASSGEEDNGSMSSSINPLLSVPPPQDIPSRCQQEALNLEVKPNVNNNNPINSNSNLHNHHRDRDENRETSIHDSSGIDLSARNQMGPSARSLGVSGTKRYLSDDEQRLLLNAIPTAHIKISPGRGRPQLDSNSLLLSLEINNILYQGFLFPQTHSDHRNRLS